MSQPPRRPTTAAKPNTVAEPNTVAPEETPAEVAEVLPPLPPAISPRRKRRLILVGAGHAHLQILDWWREKPIRGVELILVSAFPYVAYGGMLPAVLAGLISEEDVQIDLTRLTRSCQAELVVDKVVGLDVETQTLELAHFEERSFDVASIDIGSSNLREDLCQTHRVIVALKPLPTFLSRLEHRLQELLAQWRQAPGSEHLQFAVVGAGAAGVELALCLEERSHRENWPAEILIVDGGAEILPGYSAGAIQRARKLCHKRAIRLRLGSAVVDCDEDGPAELALENGERIRVDLVIWAAGDAPPATLRGFPLPLSERGYLAVRPTLQSTADVPVFAAGDVADIQGRSCQKGPVHALRQGPILWENLRQWFRAGEPVEYQPRHDFLSLLSCGDGTAILDYRGWSLRNRWMWTLKQHIDRKFVHRFQ